MCIHLKNCPLHESSVHSSHLSTAICLVLKLNFLLETKLAKDVLDMNIVSYLTTHTALPVIHSLLIGKYVCPLV